MKKLVRLGITLLFLLLFLLMCVGLQMLHPQSMIYRPKPSPATPAPFAVIYTDHMVIFQRGTKENAYGFAVITDPDAFSWVCYADRPLKLGDCENTIKYPEIP